MSPSRPEQEIDQMRAGESLPVTTDPATASPDSADRESADSVPDPTRHVVVGILPDWTMFRPACLRRLHGFARVDDSVEVLTTRIPGGWAFCIKGPKGVIDFCLRVSRVPMVVED